MVQLFRVLSLGYILQCLYITVADLHTKVSGARPPPRTGPNSFVFIYVITKKHLCQRLVPPPMRVGDPPPTGNPGSAPALIYLIGM